MSEENIFQVALYELQPPSKWTYTSAKGLHDLIIKGNSTSFRLGMQLSNNDFFFRSNQNVVA
jgi:hypothetical protein